MVFNEHTINYVLILGTDVELMMCPQAQTSRENPLESDTCSNYV